MHCVIDTVFMAFNQIKDSFEIYRRCSLVRCFFLLLFYSPKGSWNKSAKYEKLGNYWPYCTQNRAITNAYFPQMYLQSKYICKVNFPGREKKNVKIRRASCLYCTFLALYETLCAIWYHLYNLENVKNFHGGVLFLVKLKPCNFT